MRHNVVLPVVLLMCVAMVAGCVGQGSGGPIFGSDVITAARTATSTGVTEPVAITDVRTLPESTATPDQPVRLLMNIMSQDTNPSYRIMDVGIDLYDAHVMKNEAGSFCNTVQGSCMPVNGRCSRYGTAIPEGGLCKLSAGEIVPIEFRLKTPTALEIANIITKATMSWQLTYSYATSTNYDILVVSQDEILRLQQEGQTLSVPVQDTIGPGPVKIQLSAEPSFALPEQSIYLTLKLQDVGSGSPQNRKISMGKLQMTIPEGLSVDITKLPSGFSCGGNVCTNTAEIEFFRKETTPFLFLIITPIEKQFTVPHRTFTVSSKLDYVYDLRGSTILEIRPQQFG